MLDDVRTWRSWPLDGAYQVTKTRLLDRLWHKETISASRRIAVDVLEHPGKVALR